jgi:hypothetical protein
MLKNHVENNKRAHNTYWEEGSIVIFDCKHAIEPKETFIPQKAADENVL